MTDLTRLKKNYDTILKIVRDRDDGARFVQIALRLEEEIRKAEDHASAYARIIAGASPSLPLEDRGSP